MTTQNSEDESVNMYSLRRSKSVCDIPELSLVIPAAAASEADEVASVNSGVRNRGKRAAAAARSKVRNGGFPNPELERFCPCELPYPENK